ncbi:MAG: purine-nucleoside phosphorylase [Chlorobi bacterium]|nr:purine-nucleoside phosphorylase [Chlorobiota bacterium]
MTEQKERINESAAYLKALSPFSRVNFAVVTYYDSSFIKQFQAVKKINYSDIPPKFNGTKENKGEFIFASSKNGEEKFIILNGHINFYNGNKMRDVALPIYVLKELGVKNIVIVDEVGHLNPRCEVGEIALIYDHINLMGDNPLIGENDDSLGTRFPDMSNPYDEKLYSNLEKYFSEKKVKYNPSVYLGVTGPETETQAECRFYGDIGADVLGYSLVPENIAAVHSGINCIAFGMISRELVADRLAEISEEDKLKNRIKAEITFATIIADLVSMPARRLPSSRQAGGSKL